MPNYYEPQSSLLFAEIVNDYDNTQNHNKHEKKLINSIKRLQSFLKELCEDTTTGFPPLLNIDDLHQLVKEFDTVIKDYREYTKNDPVQKYVNPLFEEILQKEKKEIESVTYNYYKGILNDKEEEIILPAPLFWVLAYSRKDDGVGRQVLDDFSLKHHAIRKNDPFYIIGSVQYRKLKETLARVEKEGRTPELIEEIIKDCEAYLLFKKDPKNCSNSDLEERRIRSVKELKKRYVEADESIKIPQVYENLSKTYSQKIREYEEQKSEYFLKITENKKQPITADTMRHKLLHLYDYQEVNDYSEFISHLSLRRKFVYPENRITLTRQTIVAHILHYHMEADRIDNNGQAGALERMIIDPSLSAEKNESRLRKVVEAISNDRFLKLRIEDEMTIQKMPRILRESGIRRLSENIFKGLEKENNNMNSIVSEAIKKHNAIKIQNK
ncbi:MAG: hypothetical protein Q4B50_08120 [Bacillota bacterium]|nr:hypothetical protein [Bacillota bacterium]